MTKHGAMWISAKTFYAAFTSATRAAFRAAGASAPQYFANMINCLQARGEWDAVAQAKRELREYLYYLALERGDWDAERELEAEANEAGTGS